MFGNLISQLMGEKKVLNILKKNCFVYFSV